MISYKDKSYCSEAEKCGDTKCTKRLTEDDKKKANELKLPISWVNYSFNGCFIPVQGQDMTDMNGTQIRQGHQIIYQVGTKWEATCEVIKRNDELYFANWSDGGEEVLVRDFWHEPTDSKITKVLNPNIREQENE